MWRCAIRTARCRGNSAWARQFNFNMKRGMSTIAFGERPLCGFAEQHQSIMLRSLLQQGSSCCSWVDAEAELDCLGEDAVGLLPQNSFTISFLPKLIGLTRLFELPR
mmetsp:Transcript_26563/g.64146  ORF Transcript_26563/g.64146 Transcript_26563/m.64146 type:complete len:107 (-) Transcript_26563:203-523(-)